MSSNQSDNQEQKAQAKLELEHLRHSAAHLLAAAVLELHPDAKLTIGPATDEGFYYDIAFAEQFSDSELEVVEAKMHELVKNWQGFEKIDVSADEARTRFAGNQYKLELIDDIAAKGEAITLYKSGEFVDLCRGGHVEKPAEVIQHFKLLSVAGAYWRGSEKNDMLTRIYGTAFFSQAELDEYLQQREEAKLRDHRKLGAELNLFFIDEMVGKGLVMWLPNGTILRDEIEKLAKEKEEAAGYVRVASPHIAREELYLTSGHLPYYKESMFPPMVMDDGTYYLKAMNCPHHHRMYLHQPRSYRDLPLRLAEYGTCYRNELSGTLAGLLRVRGMSMNDAHMYCRKDQIKTEFAGVIHLVQEYFAIFGLENYWFRLSKWDPAHTEKYFNEPANWEYSEQVLREVLVEEGVEFIEAEDEAAFYGPKVDIQFKSVIGREETMSTIQLDFVAKERFGLTFTDADGSQNNEVFVIHRAPLSVHERFLAFLIEHYAGKFPVWLSPVQVKVLPITDAQNEYAQKVVGALKATHVRVELDNRAERLNAKIRTAQMEKVPYMLVVGGKEAEAGTVAVRNRDTGEQTVVPLAEFVVMVSQQSSARSA